MSRLTSFFAFGVFLLAHLASAFVPPSRFVSSPRLYSSEVGDQETPVESARVKIARDLETTSLEVTATFDDPNGSHITINVVSPLFEGVSRVKRQQMVYKAIWEEMSGPIHAVDSMVCKAPSEV